MPHFDEKNIAEWMQTVPQARRWMVQCVACKRWGMREDAPERFFSRYWVKRLGTLHIDERGTCQECQQATKRARG